jgi:hypothetical protein
MPKLLIFLLFVCIVPLTAQSKLIAVADALRVEKGYTVGITFALEQDEATNFDAPDFEGFKVISGPNQAYSTTFINGKVSQKQSWSYLLMALSEGVHNIGTAAATTKNGVLKSNSLQITVTASSAATGTALSLATRGEPLFIQAKLNTDTAYLGQAVRLDHTLYTRLPVESFQLLNEQEYSQFFARDLRRIDTQNSEKAFGKWTYASRLLKAVALIPQEAGKHEIPAATYQLGVLADPKAATPRDAYGRPLARTFRTQSVNTTAASLVVLPLPAGAPEAFCGLVGSYEIVAEVDKKNLTTDDAFLLTLRITGDGDPKMLRLPKLAAVDGLEIYEPKLVNDENWESDNRGFFHETVLEYYVVPQRTGDFTITPEITVFDPNLRAYVPIKTTPLTVSVTKGTGRRAADVTPGLQAPKSPHTRTLLMWLAIVAGIGGLIYALNVKSKKPKPVYFEPKPTQLQPAVAQAVTPAPQPEKLPEPQPEPNYTKPVVPPATNTIDINAPAEVFYKLLTQYIITELGCKDQQAATDQLLRSEKPGAATLLEVFETYNRIRYAGAQPQIDQAEVWEMVRSSFRN